MALPNFECGDEVLACCDPLTPIGIKIRDVALAAVNDPACFSGPCDNPMVDAILTVGPPTGYAPDMIFVSLLSAGPSVRSNDQRGRTKQVISWRSNWQVTLVESGWQTFENDTDGEEVVMADPTTIEKLAQASQSHGWRMYRAVADAALRGALSSCGEDCWIHVGDLVPVRPSGLTVGWQMTLGLGFNPATPCEELEP